MLGLLLIKAIRGFHGVPFSLSLSRWDEEEQREEEGEEEEEKEEENASGFRERITDQLSASIWSSASLLLPLSPNGLLSSRGK